MDEAKYKDLKGYIERSIAHISRICNCTYKDVLDVMSDVIRESK